MSRSTFQVRNVTRFGGRVRMDGTGVGVVSHAGGVLLLRAAAAAAVGVVVALSTALGRWRRTAVHDPGKVLLDLVVAVALGGDCLADVAVLREAPAVFGPVASDPTVSRLVDCLAGDADAAIAAIDRALAAARVRAWTAVGSAAPDHDIDIDRPLVLDVDATLVTAHPEKEGARPNFKKGSAFTPSAGVRRPRPGRHGWALGWAPATRQRRVQHCRGSNPGHVRGPRAAPRTPVGMASRAQGPGPR